MPSKMDGAGRYLNQHLPCLPLTTCAVSFPPTTATDDPRLA